MMEKLREIIDRYAELAAYCDRFWKRVEKKYPDAIACAPGCSTCCELPSVNYLEAFVIAGPLNENTGERATTGPCPFLENDRCSIYASRPLICRTHGLLLKSREYAYPMTASCPYNFTRTDLAAVDTTCVLEIDTVSNNLARLNAAFCLLTYGDVRKAGDRVAMRDLAGGKIQRDSAAGREKTS
jgi:uncharacterized protein